MRLRALGQLSLSSDSDAAAGPRAKPFVKWVGGKRSLLPELIDRVPAKFKDYYEPFVGGGALFFALRNRTDERGGGAKVFSQRYQL